MGQTIDVSGEVTEKGVTERAFTVARPEEPVPGILWLPEGATGPRPLVAFGHGGTQHKRAPNIVSMARRLVRHHGYAAVAIDLPYHGERAPSGDGGLSPEERRRLLRTRMFERGDETTARALGDWDAVLDAVCALDEVGPGPVGYWGVSMGTHFGVPLVAREPRIVAAVLGLFGWSARARATDYAEAARRVSVPLLFLVQWDDEVVGRDAAFELFGMFGSEDKSLHANPGRHVEIPLRERDHAEAFFARHLGPVGPATAAA